MARVAFARDCDHCGRPIAMLRTVWGSERPWRAYEAKENPTDQTHPLCRYAYSRSRGGVLQLDPTAQPGDPGMPDRVLIPHHCGREAARAAEDAMEQMVGAWLRGEAPDTDRVPVRRSNLGFRKGFGKTPPPPP